MKLQIIKINFKFIFAIVLLISQFVTYESIAQSLNNDCQTYENTRQLLIEMNRADPNKQFIKLFNIGDKQIAELTKALNDSNLLVKRNAQVIIRYLRNDSGMSALTASYNKETASIVVAGPIPIPLSEWDYNYIEKNYQKDFSGWDIPSTSFIYALAIDSSAKAKTVLNKLIDNAKNNPKADHLAFEKIKSINSNEILDDSSDLAKTVLDKAFFISTDDKKFVTSKIVTFNEAKDKALIEIHINRGALSEEWYHIVINKTEKGWRFLSITPVAVS